MDINNIALVRATNVIPFDGVVKPICNVCYLNKNISGEFQAVLSDILHELKIIEPMDEAKMFDDEYYDKMVALASKTLKQYLPYVSDYNSMVLFSLNGICPDDGEHGFANNTFSNKKCGIIEPLVHHINEVVSLVPTDTAIKGDVYLSSEAIILIEKNTYESLTELEKEKLTKLNLKISLFEGTLKEAINNELKISNRYIPETLSLSRQHKGFKPSDTSDKLIELISNIAKNYNKAQVLYFNILTGKNDELDKLDMVKDELNKAWKVQDYFLLNFLNELLITMGCSLDLLKQLPTRLHNRPFMQKVGEEIKKFGLKNYKAFVDAYNAFLEKQQLEMTLPTPNDIINEKQETRK